MVAVALISNPKSTGNRAQLPRIREFCAAHPDIFHYEVDHVEQIGDALTSIALVQPRVIAINGGDGTVQATLTELYHGGHFPAGQEPPVAVLPNGKTNLIALDLGAAGDPLDALSHVISLARADLDSHVVRRELIALSSGEGNRPVLGMFLGGAGLADVILYCRDRIYPLGLPNWLSHFLAGVATVLSVAFGARGRLFPARARPVKVHLAKTADLDGRYAILIVTTLERLLFNARAGDGQGEGRMKLLAVDSNMGSLMRLIWQGLFGRLGDGGVEGVHFGQGDEIRIEGEQSSVILDGEIFTAQRGLPITLTSTRPVPFLQLAA